MGFKEFFLEISSEDDLNYNRASHMIRQSGLDSSILKHPNELPPVKPGHVRVYHGIRDASTIKDIFNRGLLTQKERGMVSGEPFTSGYLRPHREFGDLLIAMNVPNEKAEISGETVRIHGGVSVDSIVGVTYSPENR